MIGRSSRSSLVESRCRVSQSSVSSPMRTWATPMRSRSLGRMVWIGSGVSTIAPRLVTYSTGTSVLCDFVPAVLNGSISPVRKLTGVGISRTGDWQAASSVVITTAARSASPRPVVPRTARSADEPAARSPTGFMTWRCREKHRCRRTSLRILRKACRGFTHDIHQHLQQPNLFRVFCICPPFSDDDNDGAPEAAIRGAPASLTPARFVPPGAATSTHHEPETRESGNWYKDRKANGTDESVRAFIKQRQSHTWTRQPLKSHPHPARPTARKVVSAPVIPHGSPRAPD
jgi:hypothetical protein